MEFLVKVDVDPEAVACHECLALGLDPESLSTVEMPVLGFAWNMKCGNGHEYVVRPFAMAEQSTVIHSDGSFTGSAPLTLGLDLG